MPRRGESFYVPSDGPKESSLTAGLGWLVGASTEAGQPGLVVVFSKQVIDNIARWSTKAGGILSALRDGENVDLGSASLELHTQRNLPGMWTGPILVIYGGEELLDAADEIEGNCDLLHVPWQLKDAETWARARGGRVLGSEASAEGGARVPTVVDAAFDDLTSSVNLNTGIGHPSDKQDAIRTLETLLHHGELCDPEVVRGHLLRRGWAPSGARAVAELAGKLLDGRRPRGSTGKADPSLWAYWQRRLEGSE